MPGDLVVGSIGAAIGVLMFGTNYVPVRKFETYDGAMFQWMMGNGICGMGIIAHFLFGGEIINFGLVGGALWAVSNFLVLPVVKLLGLGVGFSMYHVINMIVGYAVGRFGLFGAPLDPGSMPHLRDASVLVLVASFAFMLRVEPDMDAAAATARPSLSGPPPGAVESGAAGAAGASSSSSASASASAHVTHSHATDQRRPLLREGNQDISVLEGSELPGASGGIVTRSGAHGQPMCAPSGEEQLQPAHASRSEALLHTLFDTVDEDARRRPIYFHGVHRHVSSRIPSTRSMPTLPLVSPGGLSAEMAETSFDASGAQPVGSSFVKVLGVMLAVCAGATAGVNAVPYDIWNNSMRPVDASPLTFIYSQCLGVYIMSSALYMLYGLAARLRNSKVRHSPIRPAYLSGVMWSIGLAGMFVAIEELGMAEAYVICAIGPVMVSALISGLIFHEIQGKENVRDFCIALALQSLGVVMLALGS
mmetsp:Transcript_17584/g.43283  ORF Transcript_17584/g.43283 Transcript_17584/m.43283 type:complete len:477 (+) Transcript_17584:102-1532(+)